MDCPRCSGTLMAVAREDGENELMHSLPTCPAFDRVVTTDDAADLIEEARKKLEKVPRA